MFMNFFADHPGLQQFAMYATLWALVSVGICLPLITLKLYWNTIQRLFPQESAYHEFDRSLSPPPSSKPVPPTPPANAEKNPNHP